MSTLHLLDTVSEQLRTTGRGVKKVGPSLIAFSTGGSADLGSFRHWLRRYGYVEEAFEATDMDFSSWAILVSHPLGMPNRETVEFGLWEAAAGHTSAAKATRGPKAAERMLCSV
jgi:hypothetical protein